MVVTAWLQLEIGSTGQRWCGRPDAHLTEQWTECTALYECTPKWQSLQQESRVLHELAVL